MKEDNQFLSTSALQEVQSGNTHNPLANNLISLIYRFDSAGNITHTQGDGWEHVGLSNNDVVGSNAFEIFSFGESHFSEYLNKEFCRFESAVSLKEREAYFEHVIVADPSKKNERLCISTDITKVRLKEKNRLGKLAEAEARIAVLEQQCEHKDKILAIVAHDLRSPLTSLTALLSVLDDDDMPEELRSARAILEKQLGAVSDMLNNLLNWAARSFYNEEAAVPAPVDISGIVRHNIELISNVAKEKNIELVNETPEALLANVQGEQIDIVIRNLLLNAVKFTPAAGKITFAGNFNADSIELIIADTGVGMTKTQQEAIFTPTHVTTYGTRGEKGFGLGLLLCKEYLDANKGSISVSSNVNIGTTIKITLPVN